MKYNIIESNRFKRALKQCAKRGYDIEALRDVVNKLANGEKLPAKHNAHKLKGEYKGL